MTVRLGAHRTRHRRPCHPIARVHVFDRVGAQWESATRPDWSWTARPTDQGGSVGDSRHGGNAEAKCAGDLRSTLASSCGCAAVSARMYPKEVSERSVREKYPREVSERSIREKYPREVSERSIREKYPREVSKRSIREKYPREVSDRSIREKYPREVSERSAH